MKYVKKILIFLLLGVMIVGYYVYVNHRNSGDSTDKITSDSAVYKLITRDLNGEYYPEFPRNVVDFYAQITKAYYFYDLSEAEIEGLANQSKKLFDEELLQSNPDTEYFSNLKIDIKKFRNKKIKITDYQVQKSSEVKQFKFKDNDYAVVKVMYYISAQEGTIRDYIYQDYTLRKDAAGKWKILFWEPGDKPED